MNITKKAHARIRTIAKVKHSLMKAATAMLANGNDIAGIVAKIGALDDERHAIMTDVRERMKANRAK